MELETLALAGDIDFSLLALFTRATYTVQVVMVVLVLASFWSWAIVVQKLMVFRIARGEVDRFEYRFWSGEPLNQIYDEIRAKPRGAAERIFLAGMTEWNRSHRGDGRLIGGAQARIDRSMDVAIAKRREKLNSSLSFLATVGSTAPFVGLFGTVWGIKNAFEEIAIAQSTNLAVVAPGIAKALLATGLGLLAAIPAVIFYNKLSADEERIISRYEFFADEFATILFRQLDAD